MKTLLLTLYGTIAICASSSSLAGTLNTIQINQYIGKCIPSGYAEIVKKIALQESSLNPFAVNINGAKINRQPNNKDEAIRLISKLMQTNYSFDIGLGGINSQHFGKKRYFGRLGYTPFDALNPCTNLKMIAAILDDAYKRTGSLEQALSIYNTGNPVSGIRNGYVESVLSQK